VPEAETVAAKYVFLDIVGYTHNRSVEAQSDLVDCLNAIVSKAIASKEIKEDNLILLPTGDGMCIALLNVDVPYDLHLQLALQVLRVLHEHNEITSDAMRKFEVRIGINANLDNFVTDINGRRNVAGAGISYAQRVMSAADGRQILVGEIVYETLRHREKYSGAFRRFVAKAKHGLNLPLYQYVAPDCVGLDVSVPSQFRPRPSAEGEGAKLPRIVAAYLAQAITHREDLKLYAKNLTAGCTLTILLHQLALDSLEVIESTETNPPTLHTWGAGTAASFRDQFAHYAAQDYPIQQQLAAYIGEPLDEHSDLFEESTWLDHHFVNPLGMKRLEEEHPDIWEAFGLKKERAYL